MNVLAEGENKIFAGEDFSDLPFTKLSNYGGNRFKVKDVVSLRIQTGIPVPGLVIVVDSSRNPVETLTNSNHWSLYFVNKSWKSADLPVVETPDIELALSGDSKRALARNDIDHCFVR